MSSKTESDNTVKSGKEGEASNRSSKLNDILSKIKNKNKAATENGTAGGGLKIGVAATSKKNDSNNLDEPIVGAVATERLEKHTKNMINGDVTYSINT